MLVLKIERVYSAPPTTLQLSCVPAQFVFMKSEYTPVWLLGWETRDSREKCGQRTGVGADRSGNGGATKSVGGVWVDTARRTLRGGDWGGIGGVLPAVSLQTGGRKFLVLITGCANQLFLCILRIKLIIKQCTFSFVRKIELKHSWYKQHYLRQFHVSIALFAHLSRNQPLTLMFLTPFLSLNSIKWQIKIKPL